MRKFTGFEKGINFGGWFSQCDNTEKTYDTFITDEDFVKVRDWGLDHVRIPVDYNLVQNLDGSFKEEGFARLGRCIDMCEKLGLNMVLDLHKAIGYSFDAGENEDGFFEDEKYQEYFYSLWDEFAKRFGNRKNLAFELLNEVTKYEYKDIWNSIALKAIERIRKYAPEIKILVGGYYNNSVTAVKDLIMPVDENIVYNFHCYNPLIFTHQGAYWIPSMDTNFRMKFTSTNREYQKNTAEQIKGYMYEQFPDNDEVIDVTYFEKLFAEAIRVCEERDVALYCGEYGVIELANTEDVLDWYRCIHSVFEKHGISRAAWSYRKMDFDLEGSKYDEVREEFISLL
ncbi:MAG: cellulase family glycosylhydrolase [Erysipelotrichaceae bacterium]|nr:cellulase family glycosylhydrolase [Erysipelotrichaceae bacterium]